MKTIKCSDCDSTLPEALITRVAGLLAVHNLDKISVARRYNIFSILDVERKEVYTHSRILFSLLNPQSLYGDKYLKMFLRRIGLPGSLIDKRWRVEREWAFNYGRIDFWFACQDMCIALEMKIDAGDQQEQLKRYEEYARDMAKDYMVCYLTLTGSPPSEQSVKGVNPNRLRLLAFSEHIIEWLRECRSVTTPDSQVSSLIEQYACLIESLTEEKFVNDLILEMIGDSSSLRSAIKISDTLDAVKSDVLVVFLNSISKEAKKLGQPFDFEYIGDNYYVQKGSDRPSLCYEVFNIFDGGRTGKRIILCFSVELYHNLYAWLGFVEIDSESWYPLEIKKIRRKYPGKLEAVKKALLECFENLETDGDALHWFYLTDEHGGILNFKQFSDNCVLLRDKEYNEHQAKRIAEEMVKTRKYLVDRLDKSI